MIGPRGPARQISPIHSGFFLELHEVLQYMQIFEAEENRGDRKAPVRFTVEARAGEVDRKASLHFSSTSRRCCCHHTLPLFATSHGPSNIDCHQQTESDAIAVLLTSMAPKAVL